MIAEAYVTGFLMAGIGLVGWFVFQGVALGTLFRAVFFLGMATYLGALGFSELTLSTKGITLVRDFGVLAGVGALFTIFKHNRLLAALAVAILIMIFGADYWNILNNTIVNNAVAHQIASNPSSNRLDKNAEIFIETKEGYNIDNTELQAIIQQYDLSYQRAFADLQSPDLTDLDDYYIINIPDAVMADAGDYNAIKTALIELSAVEFLEENEIIQLDEPAATSPSADYNADAPFNDTYLNQQWGFEQIGATALYQFLNQSDIRPRKRALVAILDTGVDAKHEDLKGNYKSINKRHDTDRHSHGTHCAGIAAAVTNNRTGIASIVGSSDLVQVASVKVLSDGGFGSQQTIIRGILEAADQGADVISMSLGGVSNDSRQKSYQKAIAYAHQKGAIVVAAAGNSNMNTKDYAPAGIEGVIAVSAVDVDLNRAVFSNFVTDVKMGIAAPGVDIFSTIPNNNYASYNGTSMACPQVAGLIGLMKAFQPTLTHQQAFDILDATGIETQATNETGKFIQVHLAIQTLLANNPVNQ